MRIGVEGLSRFFWVIAVVFLESGGMEAGERLRKMHSLCADVLSKVRLDGFRLASAATWH
jgi:hypothetical protein